MKWLLLVLEHPPRCFLFFKTITTKLPKIMAFMLLGFTVIRWEENNMLSHSKIVNCSRVLVQIKSSIWWFSEICLQKPIWIKKENVCGSVDVEITFNATVIGTSNHILSVWPDGDIFDYSWQKVSYKRNPNIWWLLGLLKLTLLSRIVMTTVRDNFSGKLGCFSV